MLNLKIDLNFCSCVTVPRRHFSAGVTSLLSDVYREHVLYSGSYDENLHSWDIRTVKTPTSTIGLGGGIWRIRQIPSTKHDQSPYSGVIATACMHDGFKLVDIDKLKVVTNYSEHDSLAYGIDLKCENHSNEITIATCSFYDHLLKIWNITN